MAQFDVYVNPTVAARPGFPYLVVLQSDQLDHLSTRLVMPLQRLDRTPSSVPRRLSQTVVVEDERLFLAAQQCAPLPARVLRDRVSSLRSDEGAIRDALDSVISGV